MSVENGEKPGALQPVAESRPPREARTQESHGQKEFPAREKAKGEFVFSREAGGANRVTCAEGWLGAPRSSEDRRADSHERQAQSAAREGAGPGQDVMHLIPYSLGGHGESNLVLGERMLNESHVRAVEKDIAAVHAQDKSDTYIRVSVQWGEDRRAPEGIRHEAFKQNADGSLQKVHDSWTKLDRNPETSLREEVKPSGQNTREWASQAPFDRNHG